MIQVGEVREDESAAMKPGQVLYYLDFYSGIFENYESAMYEHSPRMEMSN